ncbi:hypothetical protein [Nitratiruptor sp. YY09-18]|uniref:hypothetical protein n=1 Tax=Nitratiruptor sp. YY09-18 TaxID=2724901 RepID=UPI0019159675|nr:hypothetical protein [Nitratiruptor sp. YY09-18]BCD67842.1 hypothetical protein NitYY0918_C0749 [Nitratiruptor sp. YY09-18]
MNRIPLAKYAKMKKMSRAEVIHKIVKGELEAEERVENGKKIRYVLVKGSEDESFRQESNPSPIPVNVQVHIQKFVDIEKMKFCYEGMHEFYLAFEDQLLIFNKESAVVTVVPKCQEK